MKVLVTGGRDYTDYEKVCSVLDDIQPTELCCGGARGLDSLVERYGRFNIVLCQVFLANWYLYGKAAGAIRNQQMLDEFKPDIGVVFPGGRGTADMEQRMRRTPGLTVVKVDV